MIVPRINDKLPRGTTDSYLLLGQLHAPLPTTRSEPGGALALNLPPPAAFAASNCFSFFPFFPSSSASACAASSILSVLARTGRLTAFIIAARRRPSRSLTVSASIKSSNSPIWLVTVSNSSSIRRVKSLVSSSLLTRLEVARSWRSNSLGGGGSGAGVRAAPRCQPSFFALLRTYASVQPCLTPMATLDISPAFQSFSIASKSAIGLLRRTNYAKYCLEICSANITQRIEAVIITSNTLLAQYCIL